MSKLKDVQFKGTICGGELIFNYEGEYFDVQKVFKTLLFETWNSQWTENDIFWAFFPPEFSIEAKNELLSILNARKNEILQRCHECYNCLELTNPADRQKIAQHISSIPPK